MAQAPPAKRTKLAEANEEEIEAEGRDVERPALLRCSVGNLRPYYEARLSSTAPGNDGGRGTSEEEVGIAWFLLPGPDLSPHLRQPSFRALLKCRYSDFIVHEVDTNDTIIRLTSTTFVSPTLPQLPPRPAEVPVPTLQHADLALAPSEIDAVLALSAEASKSESAGSSAAPGDRPLFVDIDCGTKPKPWRTLLHTAIKAHFPSLLSETLSPEAQQKALDRANKTSPRSTKPSLSEVNLPPVRATAIIRITANSKKARGLGVDTQRSIRPMWAHPDRPFLQCVLYKENKDTQEALAVISRMLHIRPSAWTLAGTKDKRALTSQLINAKFIDPVRLAALNSRLIGIRTGNYEFVSNSLRLGELKGNRFDLVLRHLAALGPNGADSNGTFFPPSSVTSQELELLKSNKLVNSETESEQSPLHRLAWSVRQGCELVRDVGFINYFGMQRFGTSVISTHLVGLCVLKGDWKGATNLILQPRLGETAEMLAARQFYFDHPNASVEDILARFPKQLFLETQLIKALKKQTTANTEFNAFQTLPLTMRLMYVHAFQSYTWNRVASERLKRFGLEPIIGDLVVTNPEGIVDVNMNISGAANEDDGPDISQLAEPTEQTPTSPHYGKRPATIVQVRALTEVDIRTRSYSIYDIVLPLPGHDVMYPANDISEVYNTVLAENGLTSANWMNKHKEYHLFGHYRKLLARPLDFSWSWDRGENNMDLLVSDLVRLAETSSALPNNNATQFHEVGPTPGEPSSPPSTLPLVLRLSFTLPSSTYATMLIRQLTMLPSTPSFQKQFPIKTE